MVEKLDYKTVQLLQEKRLNFPDSSNRILQNRKNTQKTFTSHGISFSNLNFPPNRYLEISREPDFSWTCGLF